MIAGEKLLFVARRKLTLSPDDCKNDVAEFLPPAPGDPGALTGEVGGCVVLGIHYVL